LCFFPLPQGHGSLRPTLMAASMKESLQYTRRHLSEPRFRIRKTLH
jgi:hypothetical protein